MPPHEAYLASLSPRHDESDEPLLNYVLPLVVVVIAFLGLFVAYILNIESYKKDLCKARSENREILNSLIITRQELNDAIDVKENQRRDLRRLHKIGSRYVAEHGPLPPAVLEQIAAEIEQLPDHQDWESARNSSSGAQGMSVAGGDEEGQNETRARASVISEASAVETDPAAPRIATSGAVHTATCVSVEEADRKAS
ncbi:hypothetical protein LX36DRAFT_21615 [Colletotrichum falcatum]|nr:hypothetical protein LX36DRAFT_21615 [Colletotrichum falcatum]